MFIATANTTGPVPAPLLDRMEVLRLSGYTEREKERIAFDHLIPRETVEAGLRDDDCRFSADAVALLIREYTAEAGLRDLQRQIASVCRKVAREILSEKKETVEILPETVRRFLGPPKFRPETADAKDRIGVATGLALTEAGGQIMFIEASMMKGGRNLILTGSLGDVMKESAQAALSYLRSHTDAFGIDNGFFEEHDIHIHVPAGAIPKDGPSAGLTIAVALSSLLTQTPCKRQVALTGELTLVGRILSVGGMKEKLLVAHRSGVTTAIFPEKDRHDLVGVPEDVKEDLGLCPPDEFDDVVGLALKGWKTR
jgi:ATP-dependent Lon protease